METLINLTEMVMVICFGMSWPLNITKAWKARSTQGTSVLFYVCICTGYAVALVGKACRIYINLPQPWYVTVPVYIMFFYVLNMLMVFSGILIYFRNRRLERRAGKRIEHE